MSCDDEKSNPIDPPPPEGEGEERADPAASGVHALDVCPNCGAPMRGGDTIVCLECGYDLKTMAVVETVSGGAASDDADADREDESDPLAVAVGPSWLALALAGAAGAVLVAGFLVGATGLYRLAEAAAESDAAPVIAWPLRIEGLGRLVVIIGLWTACGVGGLRTTAWMLERPLGDLRRAAASMLAVVSIARLVTFLDLPGPTVELLVEGLGEALVFLGASIVLFRLPPRSAAIVLGFTALSFLVLYATAWTVVWVT